VKDSILELYIDFILDFISSSFLDIVMSLPQLRVESEILVYNQGQAKLVSTRSKEKHTER